MMQAGIIRSKYVFTQNNYVQVVSENVKKKKKYSIMIASFINIWTAVAPVPPSILL